MSAKTKSELLFEQYLDIRGYTDWEHEPADLLGQTKRPDYLLRFGGRELLLEVKEMHEKRPHPGGLTSIDPYAGLRSEIDEARFKFKRLKDFCCSLVVYNLSDWEVRLGSHHVYGAMLGDLGFAFHVNVDTSQPPPSDEIENIFMEGGKMLRPGKRVPQNTTISSVVVVDELRAFKPKVHRAAQQAVKIERKRLGRDLTLEEAVITEHNVFCSVPNSWFGVIRVRVFENPFAAHPFPREVFCGPYEMRWVYDLEKQQIVRIFVGPKMAAMEEVRAETDEQDEAGADEIF